MNKGTGDNHNGPKANLANDNDSQSDEESGGTLAMQFAELSNFAKSKRKDVNKYKKKFKVVYLFSSDVVSCITLLHHY